jgi:hypothetical protein
MHVTRAFLVMSCEPTEHADRDSFGLLVHANSDVLTAKHVGVNGVLMIQKQASHCTGGSWQQVR